MNPCIAIMNVVNNDAQAGYIKLQLSQDGIIRFYAHGLKHEKLGRFDSQKEAVKAVSDKQDADIVKSSLHVIDGGKEA